MHSRNIGLLSAGVAFFSLLAIFPGLAAIISVLGFFADPLVLQDQLSMLDDLLPPAAYTLLANQVTRLVWANDGVLGWASLLSLFVALYLARLGVNAMLIGINAIHGTPRRTGFSHALRVAGMTLGMVLAGVVALLSVLVLPLVLAFFPVPGVHGLLIDISRWSLTLGMVALWIWIFYRLGPNRPSGQTPRMRPGLALAMLLWISASVGFSYYLQNFGNYNEVYGSLGAVVALLMWFYISAYSVLLGGVLNATLEDLDTDAPLSPMSDETAPPETE